MADQGYDESQHQGDGPDPLAGPFMSTIELTTGAPSPAAARLARLLGAGEGS